ncbi:hypothetical protein RND71_037115 [Anisodus tanguticus]|uniref:Phytocyanin domain-containing protein n=1 Tax=Anisodus tanguticus TaxID=243964 RepID=A0AAE1UYJ4_9SOLA|nr:hypothetical protein RND71_037115 [Anisodus tanguticus]
MAQTGSRWNKKGIHNLGLIISLLLLIQNGNAYDFKVGNSGDWSVPLDANANDYNRWAERSRFQIGDTLLFVYPADKDSVLLVTKEDYANCSTTSPIEKYSDGHSVFKFIHSGPFYFISGVHDNCVKNEKLLVVVMADRSNKNQTPSPSPSLSTSEVPPAPAPSVEETPPPPTNSVEMNPTPAPSQESSPPMNGASSIVMSFVGSIGAFIGSSILLGI